MKITWDAPTEGIHTGNIGTLTYDVYRISNNDTVKVASDVSDTSYTDNTSTALLANYSYGVRAKSNELVSDMSVSYVGIIAGKGIEPDWTDEFNDDNDYSSFTVVDANDDGRTWRYNSYYKFVYSNNNSYNGNDDWLFTPPLHLAPGRLYTLSFLAKNDGDNYHNTLEVKWGNTPTAEGMTNTLQETFEPKTDGDNVYSYDIYPTADDNYYIGFHDNTAVPNQLYIIVDSIVIAKGAVDAAPRSVSNLKVAPADKGDLSATISFNVPTENIKGDAISGVDSIQIRRDGTVISTLPKASAGSALSYVDSKVTVNGTHKYDVVAYLDNNYGQKASATAFVGQDVPSVPDSVTLADNKDNVLAKWNKASDHGANGGYVKPENVAVTFYNVQQGQNSLIVTDSVTTSAKGATSAVIPQDPEKTTVEDGTTQTFYQLAARADGDAGKSGFVATTPVLIGPSIKLPFKESFASGNIDNKFAWISSNDQFNNNQTAAGWLIDSQHSADGDGGCALWHSYSQATWYGSLDRTITAGDETSLNSPKISLAGSIKPMLYFSLYSTVNDPASLEILVQTPDGKEQKAEELDLSSTSTEGWSIHSLDLSQYQSERYVILHFNGKATGSDACIVLDNINVFNQLEYNMKAIDINAPSEITAGKTAKINVQVQNIGAHPASGYSVVLYANNQPVDTVVSSKALDILSKDTVTLTLPVAINQEAYINVKATVLSDGDLDESDNTTDEKVVSVKPSEYVKVNDLKADAEGNGVGLTWSEPDTQEPVKVTEDFEGYKPFSTLLGDWTLVDGDKGLSVAFFEYAPYPGQGTSFAFDAFNPNAITDAFNVTDNNPGLVPHSGKQFAGAPHASDASGKSYVDADNWLISPELSGQKQTISFYAFNIAADSKVYKETFDVLYSVAGKDTTDFVKLESDAADGTTSYNEGANWKQITVELPEGAKYFAIHHNTDADNNFLFGVDDISFSKAGLGASDSIVGYNIYRDGTLIATVGGDSQAYTDVSADNDSHVYNVTVVYQDADGNRNESGFSNSASITVTGINEIVADKDGHYNVYTIDGKTVMKDAKNLDGLAPGLYIINDRKYIVK